MIKSDRRITEESNSRVDFEERSLLSLLFYCLFVCSLSNIRLDAKNDGKDSSKTTERE